jgi:glycosyltransferase involved in cell wall biosynthesis
MKITFLVPSIDMSGGTKVIFEYANHLQQRGHDVIVVYPLVPPMLGLKLSDPRALINTAIRIISNLVRAQRVNWFDLKARLLRVTTFAEKYMPDADVVVATWWATVYYVSRYGKRKGEKFYLIQHYELWGGPKEQVENTYKLGLHNIVISTWLKNILEDKIKVPVEALVTNAIDFNQFHADAKEKGNKVIRVLMPYRSEKWKGIPDGIKAFEIAKEKYPQIQLVMFGPSTARDLPGYVEYHRSPYGERLRRIYTSCDIFLFPSHAEGFGLPPMEAMACKCAVAATNVGGIPDYTIPGVTALVSPPGCPDLLAENLIRLIEDKELREKVASAGHDYVGKFTWDKATDKLDKLFMDALSMDKAS